MNNFISTGSKTHFYNPVKELLDISNRLHKKYSNLQTINMSLLLSYIPSIEGNKIENFLSDICSTNFISKLQKFGYSKTVDYLSLEKQFPIMHKYPDIKNMLIYYSCIFWYLDTDNPYDFSTIISLLNITRENLTSTDQAVHDFCFELILNKAMSISKSTNSNVIFIPLFLTYIMSLKNLPNSSFYLLYTLFSMASSTGSETDLNLLQRAIKHIFKNDFDFLKNEKNASKLIDLLHINFDNLNSRSLKILGLVTHERKASMHVMEIVHTIYKQFYEFVISNCKDDESQLSIQFVNEKNKQTNKIIRFEKQAKLPKQTFKFDNRKNSMNFIQFPFSMLSFKNKKTKILKDCILEKVDKLSDFLSKASNDVVSDFIAQFSVFLNIDNFFFALCASFLEILIKTPDIQIIETVVELLSQSKLFLPSFTIFDSIQENHDLNFYLDERINYLRDKVFELISIKNPLKVSILISAAQYYPFLLTEHFMRILLRFDKFAPQIFCEEPTKTLIIYSGLDLELLYNEEEAKNNDDKLDLSVLKCSYLTFIQHALTNEGSCDIFFSYQLFVDSFLSFVYQPYLQMYILSTFRKSLSLMNPDECKKYSSYIVDFYRKMVDSSIEEKDSQYHDLVEKAFSALLIGIQYNISISQNFITLFETLLSYISFSPSICLVLISLKFFQVFSFTEAHWKLSSRHFYILYEAIGKVCGKNLDDRIVTSIFCCLGNSSFLTSKETIVILYPSILTLLFLIHSKVRTKNVELLRIFLKLCQYSNSNALAFHEAYIDLILIQFLCLNADQGVLNFECHDFEFDIDRKAAMPVIIDFLWHVTQSKPNFAISKNMVNLLTITDDDIILNSIVSMLYSSETIFKRITKIPLDTREPVISVNDFDWTRLKSTFVLDFYLVMDEMLSKRFRCSFTIFTITDEINTLQINIKNGSLQAFFKTPEKTSSAFLFKNIFNLNQNHFSMTFVITKDKTKIFNFLNGDRSSDAYIDKLVFTRPVKMFIGGSDFVSKSLNHPCFGKIFSFQFFTSKLTEDDITVLNEEPSQFTKKPLFSTNFIKSEANRVLTIEYKDMSSGGTLRTPSKNRLLSALSTSSQQLVQASANLQEQQEQQEAIQTITMELLPSFHRSYHILDFFCEVSLYPQILRIQRLDVLLDVLFCCFTKHPELQKFFKPHINALFNHVIQKVELSAYLSLFRFMGILVNESMRLEWFEMFIINIVLWSKSNQFNEIVNHWNMSLKQYKAYFINKNYLDDLLTQFMLIFQFEKNPDSTNHEDEEIMRVFCRFLINIAQLKFEPKSFDILLSCILMCEDESNLYELVKILYSISTTKVAINSITKKKLKLLHKLFRFQNVELTICSIICLNNLSIIFPDYDTFAIAYFLIGHSELDKIVDILIQKFPKYPNLISLLVVLSLQSKKQELLVDSIKKNFLIDSSNINMIFSRNYWYIWPILLMLNVSDQSCDVLCDFMAIGIVNLQIANANDRLAIIDEIFILIFRLSFMKPSFPIAFHILQHLLSLFAKKNYPYPQYISRYCFIFFFFQCPSPLHSNPLLQAYLESTFCEDSEKIIENEIDKNSNEQKIFNIFELESLVSFDFFNFQFLCRINIDTSLNLNELNYHKLYLYINPPNSPTFDTKLLQSFCQPFDPSEHNAEQIAYFKNQLAVFDAFQNEMKNFIRNEMTNIRKGILKLLQESRINMSNINSDEIRPFTHIFLSSTSNQLQKTTPKIEKGIQINMKKKDNKLTPMLFPFQLKNKAIARKSKSYSDDSSSETLINISNGQRIIGSIVKMFGKPLSKFQCIISKFNSAKNEKEDLFIFDNAICFTTKNQKKKFICFDDIKFLLFRKVKDGFGYEIITDTFVSILFFVMHSNFSELTMVLKSFPFKNALFVTFSSDFASQLSNISKLWQKNQISNFEYLLKLNILSGHSFFQYHLYPVLPPIVSIYDDIDSNPDFDELQLRPINSLDDSFFNMNVRENFTNYLTVMADYYFDFSYLTNKDIGKNNGFDSGSLPKWARNKLEFIYINRKKLEKIDISRFIDKVFGCESDVTGGSFVKLFKKPHEKRQPLKSNVSPLLNEISLSLSSSAPTSPKLQPGPAVIKPIPLSVQRQLEAQDLIESQIQMPIQIPIQSDKLASGSKSKNEIGYLYRFGQKVVASTVFFNMNWQIRFWIVLSHHKICYVRLSDGLLKVKYTYEIEDLIDEDNDNLVPFYSQCFIYLYSSRKSTVYYLNTSKKQICQIPVYTDQPLFAIFDDQLIYSQRECSLYKMNVDTLTSTRYCLTKSKLTALASSKQFNIVVYATIDGFVHVSSFSANEEINEYNAGFEIKNIIITLCMGFILASNDDQIVVLTVNGEYVTQYRFNFLVRNMYSLTIFAGVDCIAFDTTDKEVGYFEIFYPEKYHIIKKFNSEVKRITYDPFDNVFIVVQSNGSIELIYHYISI